MTSTLQEMSFEPSQCPRCQQPIEAVRRGRTHEQAAFEPPTIEPCGHTIASYLIKVGGVAYER